MPRVSLWFFAVAPIYVLIGMSFGIFMGATENFTLAPAHAHLNLIGWVTMALYGTFYALAREASKKLAWTVFWLNNAGAAIMFPSLAMVLSFGGSRSLAIDRQRIPGSGRDAVLRLLGVGRAGEKRTRAVRRGVQTDGRRIKPRLSGGSTG
jgi:hypothetical protein